MSRLGARRMRPRDCVLIFGNAKSGTKRLLRIFDLSRETHCRNEPYNLTGSPWQLLRTLPRGWVNSPADDALVDREWDRAVEWSALRMGERDRLPPPPKDHLHAYARRLGLLHLLASRSARRVMGVFTPSLREPEWPLPRWAGDPSKLRSALTVLKINQSPSFAVWALANRPRQQVVHIVRHPGAMLHSWNIRYRVRQDRDKVVRENVERLKTIAHREPSWANRFGNVERMSAEEGELWFWVYATRTTHEAGVGHPQYRLVLDEHIVQQPTEEARNLFEVCDLVMDRGAECELRKRAVGWQSCTAHWRDLLQPQQITLVERVLDERWLAGWWDNDQIVSRADYQ